MQLKERSRSEIQQHLRGPGLCLDVGPFVVRIHSRLDAIAEGVSLLYRDVPSPQEPVFCDFHVTVDAPPNLRRFYKKQVIFTLDGHRPFKPLPQDHALPVLEWGLNWCVANHSHQFLMIHAAVVEKAGYAFILPGPPGSGKSTLCAGLVARGWRLLSDEMALIDLKTGQLCPSPRPISLKNDSIDIIRQYWPDAVVGPASHGTDKGTVAHIRPPTSSVQQRSSVRPACILFPKFIAGQAPELTPLPRARALMQIIDSTFNYHGLGETAFNALATLVDNSHCRRLTYSRLDDAIAIFNELCEA